MILRKTRIEIGRRLNTESVCHSCRREVDLDAFKIPDLNGWILDDDTPDKLTCNKCRKSSDRPAGTTVCPITGLVFWY